MEWDVLLLTRTIQHDYTWICRPAYVDSSVNTLIRPLMIAVESQENRKLFEKYGKRNFLFFLEQNYCALVYLYFTDRVDLAGRRIYSLEGLCCKKSESRTFWRLLPFVIKELYGKGISGTSEICNNRIRVENESRAEIPGIEEYLKRSLDALMNEFKDMDYSFLNLLEEIYLTDQMFPFLYGNYTDDYPVSGETHIYQLGEEKKIFQEQPRPVLEKAPEQKCHIFFRFTKDTFGYLLDTGAVTEENQMISKLSHIANFGGEGIHLDRLLFLEKVMEKHMDKYGFCPVSKIWKRGKMEKEFYYNENIFYEERWNLHIAEISCQMRPEDGPAGCFKRQEDGVIRQLFQYAWRIEKEYFSGIREFNTLYIMTFSSGLWIFRFTETLGKYYLKGISIEKKEQEQAWNFLEELIREYLFCDVMDSLGEFGEIFNSFLADAREMLHPRSFILSVFPEGNFPAFNSVKVYTTPGMKKLFHTVRECGYPKNSWKSVPELRRVVVCPPKIGKKWKVNYLKAPENREIEESFPSQTIVPEREKNREAVRERETFLCYADEFFEEFINMES